MKEYWIGMVARAFQTFCQSAAAILIAAGTGLFNTDWKNTMSVAIMAFILSILTTIGGNTTTNYIKNCTGQQTLQQTVESTNNASTESTTKLS